MGCVSLKKLIQAFDDVDNISRVRAEDICRAIKSDIKTAVRIKESIRDISRAREKARELRKKGYLFYCPGDIAYPSLLKEIYDPPAVLYSRGKILERDYNAVAVVGTRKASGYGKAAACALARGLAAYNITVVSGAAYGIDTAAHKAVLEAGGRTIAVLGGGLDRPYPASNKNLLDRISENGAVLSEYEPGRPPSAHNFPRRNRIISGLCHGVVVVEAPKRSGALITAAMAGEQGRQVYAVPGSIFSSGSAGTLGLIRDGAVPVGRVEEIVEDIKMQLDGNLMQQPRPRHENSRLSDEGRDILNMLSKGAVHVDIIKNKLKMDISFLISHLTELELKGKIRKISGEKYIRTENE
ncbi:MAG: DNA-processing protein DprA [Elusimicrobiota bacterium]